MKPLTNKIARQISSSPVVHRQSTLQAISSKAHADSSAVRSLGLQAQRLKGLMDQASTHTGSKLQWLQGQLNNQSL